MFTQTPWYAKCSWSCIWPLPVHNWRIFILKPNICWIVLVNKMRNIGRKKTYIRIDTDAKKGYPFSLTPKLINHLVYTCTYFISIGKHVLDTMINRFQYLSGEEFRNSFIWRLSTMIISTRKASFMSEFMFPFQIIFIYFFLKLVNSKNRLIS